MGCNKSINHLKFEFYSKQLYKIIPPLSLIDIYVYKQLLLMLVILLIRNDNNKFVYIKCHLFFFPYIPFLF